MVSLSKQPRPADTGPAWDVARLFPDQGQWREGDFFVLTSTTNGLVELVDGRVEVLEMPNPPHQFIVAYLYRMLYDFVVVRGLGQVLFAPVNVRLRPDLIRQPDVVVLLKEHAAKKTRQAWNSADLVVEVVSEGAESRERDLVEKRREYAEAQVSEYWIVDPQEEIVTVLKLVGGSYEVHGAWRRGGRANSALLSGLEIDVAAMLVAARDN